MSDNYYSNQYSQSGTGNNQYYPPRDSYAQQGGRENPYPPPPQSDYNTYRPPTDEGYRASPVPPNMQVAPYDDRNRNRRSGEYAQRSPRSRYDNDDDRYSDRNPKYLDARDNRSARPSSRGSHKASKGNNDEVKAIGATIVGGIAGALIGRKAGHKDILPTVIGGVAGAWGGHKVEEEFEKHKDQKRSRSRNPHDRYGGGGDGERGRRGSDASDRSRKSFREKITDRVRSLSRGAKSRISGAKDERSRSRSRNRRSNRDRDRDSDSDSEYEDRRPPRRSSARYDDGYDGRGGGGGRGYRDDY